MFKTLAAALYGMLMVLCFGFMLADVFWDYLLPQNSLQALVIGMGLIVFADKFFGVLEDK